MSSHTLSTHTLEFLKELGKNNNRDWFDTNKSRYTQAHEDVLAFTESLREQMDKIDVIVPESAKRTLFRIYRDIRFSKDKTPYKTRFAGRLKRDTASLRGGYFYRIGPGQTAIVGGFWGPNSDDMARIRYEIDVDPQPLRDIIASKGFKKYFGELQGEQVKSAPRGYKKDNPNIDLLRKKQFLLMREFSDEEALSPGFLKETIATYKAMRPFFNYMSEVLSTDKNGMPLI